MLVPENGRVLFSALEGDVYGTLAMPDSLDELAGFLLAHITEASDVPRSTVVTELEAFREHEAMAVAAVEKSSRELVGVALSAVFDIGEIIGKGDMEELSGFITAIVVRPDLQRNGIGTRLARASVAFLSNPHTGLGQREVYAMHGTANQPAAGMFEKARMAAIAELPGSRLGRRASDSRVLRRFTVQSQKCKRPQSSRSRIRSS